MMFGAFLAAHAWSLVAMAALLGFSAFFSGSETALFNLSMLQRRRMAESSSPVQRLAARLLRKPQRLLNTILFGNMMVNVAFAAISALLIYALRAEGFPAWVVSVCWVAPLVTVILLGEVTPKAMAILAGPTWARAAAPLLYGFQRLFSPVIRLLDATIINPLTRLIAYAPPHHGEVTAEELAELMDLSARRGQIGFDASAMLQEILELTDLRVADIMVPRVDMVCYDIDDPPSGLLELFRETSLRRMPVYRETPDSIVGVINAKQLLLNPEVELRELLRPPLFVPGAANLEQLLAQFRRAGRQLAVVVDEYGGTAGLVTLQDVLEEIVGELPDAPGEQAEPLVRRISRREYLVDGNLGIHEWADVFGIDLAASRISTIGGFVTSRIGRIARAGDVVHHENLRFTVERMRQRRVATVRVELLEDPS